MNPSRIVFLLVLINALAHLACEPKHEEPKSSYAGEITSPLKAPPLPSGEMLVDAARRGFYKDVVRLLSNGMSPDVKDRDGQTALHAFFSGENWRFEKRLLDLLLDSGASLEAKDSKGRTPLHHAVLRGREKLLRVIINRGAKINEGDSLGLTPLHLAASRKRARLIRLLVENGADINAQDHEGRSALHLAEENKAPEAAFELALLKADIRLADSYGHQANGWLAAECLNSIGKPSLGSGDSRPLCMEIKSLMEPTVFVAASSGQEEVVRFLLARGADPNQMFAFNQEIGTRASPLHVAAFEGNSQITSLLLKKGAKPNLADGHGWTALHRAILKGHSSVIKTLLRGGAKTAKKTRSGQSSCQLAKERGTPEIIALVCKRAKNSK